MKDEKMKKEKKEVITRTVTIRNRKLKKNPRVCDAVVTIDGQLIRLEIQNIKGATFIDYDDIDAQIKEALSEKK